MKSHVDEFARAFQSHSGPKVLLDVRDENETALGTAPGAVTLPLPELAARKNEIPLTTAVFIYCGSGGRAAKAAAIFEESGWANVHSASEGGYKRLAEVLGS